MLDFRLFSGIVFGPQGGAEAALAVRNLQNFSGNRQIHQVAIVICAPIEEIGHPLKR